MVASVIDGAYIPVVNPGILEEGVFVLDGDAVKVGVDIRPVHSDVLLVGPYIHLLSRTSRPPIRQPRIFKQASSEEAAFSWRLIPLHLVDLTKIDYQVEWDESPTECGFFTASLLKYAGL